MPTFLQQLHAKIVDAKRSPDAETEFDVVTFAREFPNVNRIMKAIGHVNDRQVGDGKPGQLLFHGAHTEIVPLARWLAWLPFADKSIRHRITHRFAFRHRPWNHVGLNCHSGEMTDTAGNRMRPSFNLESLAAVA